MSKIGAVAITAVGLRCTTAEAAPPSIPVAPTAAVKNAVVGTQTPPDTLLINVKVQLHLSKLDPLARTGSLTCYARVFDYSEAQSDGQMLVSKANGDLASEHFDNWIGQPASYFGGVGKSAVFPISGSAYDGSQPVQITVTKNAMLLSPGKMFPDPRVLVGCRLFINDMRARAVSGSVYQLPDANNVAVVTADSGSGAYIVFDAQRLQNMW